MLLISNRLNLDEVDINAINDLIFYKIADANKINELYNKIRIAINSGEVKYNDIILNKCSINKGVLYYLDRL